MRVVLVGSHKHLDGTGYQVMVVGVNKSRPQEPQTPQPFRGDYALCAPQHTVERGKATCPHTKSNRQELEVTGDELTGLSRMVGLACKRKW